MKLVFESQFTNLLILLNGLVFLIFLYYRRKKQERAMKFGNFETLKKVADKRFLKTDDIMLLTKLVAITCLIIAISSPVLVHQERVSESNYAILLDASGSMFTSDISPSRFQAAKESASNFVDELPNETQVGFLKYAGEVENTTGMSSRNSEIEESIRDAELGDSAGTAIGSAVSSGVDMLREVDRPRRIILLTDGTNNQGISLESAAERAESHNVSIYAIGIGEPGNDTQEYGILRGENVTRSDSPNLNPDRLRMLAEKTSGNVSIVSNRTGLENAFVNLETETVRTDLAGLLIILSGFLLVLEWILKATDYEVLP